MEIYPEEGFAIFVSANTPAGGTLLDELPELLLDLFYPTTVATPRRAKDAQAEAQKVAGVYRSLRVPAYRSEAAPVRYVSELAVRSLPGGDIEVAGSRLYKPLGEGVFGSIGDHDRIAFHDLGGRMSMFDPSGIFLADQIRFFETRRWLLWILGATATLALGRSSRPSSGLFATTYGARRGDGSRRLEPHLARGRGVAPCQRPFVRSTKRLSSHLRVLPPIACWALLAAAV